MGIAKGSPASGNWTRLVRTVFWPYLVLLVPFLLVFGLGGFVNLLISLNSWQGWSVGLSSLAMAATSVLLIIGIAVVGAKVALDPVRMAVVFYVGQVLLASLVACSIYVAIGGVSMAIVEGSVSRAGLGLVAMRQALLFLGLAHLFIVPWTVFSVRRMTKTPQPS